MKKAVLKSYAKLIVRSGLAVRPGQPVIIKANVDQEAFAAMVAKECYNAGASRVVMSWQSEKLNRIDLKKGHLRPFMKNLPQELAYQQWFTEALPCYLWLNSDDPDALKGTNPKKAGKIRAAKNEEVKSLIKARENRYQWCIAAIPSEKWAKKVFPHLNKAEGIKKLWEAILVASRAYEGDPIANWEDHDHTLKQKCAKLNSLQLKSLHYTSSNGTDLTVGLNPDVIWLGGGETTVSGAYFQPNIPSEECFTSPIKGQAEGIVSARTFANLVYVMRKELGPEKIEEVCKLLSLIFHFADFSVSDMNRAAEMKWKDFEDAIQSATAERVSAAYLITRNVKDFSKSKVPALTPAEFLARL